MTPWTLSVALGHAKGITSARNRRRCGFPFAYSFLIKRKSLIAPYHAVTIMLSSPRVFRCSMRTFDSDIGTVKPESMVLISRAFALNSTSETRDGFLLAEPFLPLSNGPTLPFVPQVCLDRLHLAAPLGVVHGETCFSSRFYLPSLSGSSVFFKSSSRNAEVPLLRSCSAELSHARKNECRS